MTPLSILTGTPLYVWLLLAALIALGVSQLRTRHLAPTRVLVVPLILMGWSAAGAAASFGWHAWPVLAWLAGLAVAVPLTRFVLPWPRAAWLVEEGRFRVDGSVWPLVLVLGIFSLKYASGVALALHPELATTASFALPFSAGFGLFAGIFATRNLSVLLARRTAEAAPAPAPAQA